MNGTGKETRRQTQLRLLGELRPRFLLERGGVVIVTMFVGVVFPIIEAILLELEFPTGRPLALWLSLGSVSVLHLALAIILTIRATKQESLHSIEALESLIHLDTLEEELAKKREAYRLAREVFETLNVRTCRLQDFSEEVPENYDWCEEGLEPGLSNLMSTLVDNRSSLLGVVGSQWTIEIYLDPVSIQHPSEANDAEQTIRYQRVWVRCSEGLLTCTDAKVTYQAQEYPVGIACTNKDGFVRTLEEDRHLLPKTDDGELDPSRVYYTRYAVQPFLVACSEEDILGTIFATAEQDASFNEDILDTLRFYGAVIANFVYAYGECMWKYYEWSQSG